MFEIIEKLFLSMFWEFNMCGRFLGLKISDSFEISTSPLYIEQRKICASSYVFGIEVRVASN